MNDEISPELDDELRAMLRRTRDLDGYNTPGEARSEAKRRVRERVWAALPPLPLPPGSGGAGPAPETPASPLPAAATTSAALSWKAGYPAWSLAAMLSMGLAGGFVAGRQTASSPPPTPGLASTALSVHTAYISPMVSSSHDTLGLNPDQLPRVPTQAVSGVAAPTAMGHGAGVAADLSREREILDIAKTALGRGDANAALARTDEHARAYPRGALAEEREALAVQALVAAGRAAEAKARAARFAKVFPKSVLLPAVRASIGEEP